MSTRSRCTPSLWTAGPGVVVTDRTTETKILNPYLPLDGDSP